MTDLLVIVPTRGRPANAERLAHAIAGTAGLSTSVVFAVDQDDPELDEYRSRLTGWAIETFPRLSMVAKLNRCAFEHRHTPSYLGFMGDDHLPRTAGWDEAVMSALGDGPSVVWCNDLHQGPNLPTSVFLHAWVIQALGWMALPTVEHLYCDNAWLDLGQALGAATYLDDVIIEHVHPHAGKADMDDQYRHVNSRDRDADDGAAWRRWRSEHLTADVARIRGYR